jgi:hypothetical protein
MLQLWSRPHQHQRSFEKKFKNKFQN